MLQNGHAFCWWMTTFNGSVESGPSTYRFFMTPSRTISLSGSLVFGDVAVGSSETSTLTISDDGNSDLHITSISYPSGFSVGWSSGTITAGGSQPVTVTFAPTSATGYSGPVTVNSDATNSGGNTITASGTGTAVAATTTTLSTSPTPSDTYGTQLAFTATVASGSGTPNGGSVTFYDGSTELRSVSVSAGTAAFTTTSLGAGARQSHGGLQRRWHHFCRQQHERRTGRDYHHGCRRRKRRPQRRRRAGDRRGDELPLRRCDGRRREHLSRRHQ